MKNRSMNLRSFAVMLLIMIGTAALTRWYTVAQYRRKVPALQPASIPKALAEKSVTSAVASPVTSPDGDNLWTPEEIRSLRQNLGNPTMEALLELLRDRNGAAVNYRELMAHTGRTMPQVRADLSMLSRKARAINAHTNWPIDAVPPTDQLSNRAYSIPTQYLDWWFQD